LKDTYNTIHLLFLSREIDIKLYQNYTKTDICQILYKSCRAKQIIFNNYETNLKTIISHRSLSISGLLLLYLFNFYFAFFIDIIDNILTYSPYRPYYVTITSANDSQVLPYTPFHFSLTVPLSSKLYLR